MGTRCPEFLTLAHQVFLFRSKYHQIFMIPLFIVIPYACRWVFPDCGGLSFEVVASLQFTVFVYGVLRRQWPTSLLFISFLLLRFHYDLIDFRVNDGLARLGPRHHKAEGPRPQSFRALARRLFTTALQVSGVWLLIFWYERGYLLFFNLFKNFSLFFFLNFNSFSINHLLLIFFSFLRWLCLFLFLLFLIYVHYLITLGFELRYDMI